MKQSGKRVCSNCLTHEVKFIGTTPSGNQWLCTGRCSWNVTPCFMEDVTPVEDVTKCLYCGNEMSGYSNKKTCSSRCRKAVSRNASLVGGKPSDYNNGK